MQDFYDRLTSEGPGHVQRDLKRGEQLMDAYKAALTELEIRQRELSLAEKLFDLPITMYSNLVAAQKELTNLAKVYALYKEFCVSGYSDLLLK